MKGLARFLVLPLLAMASPAWSQAPTDTAAVLDERLPPPEQAARAALERSPRHGEWVDVKVPDVEKPILAYVVYPERKDKAPAVIVIHEVFGLSDWIRGVADQLAEDGFLAIAPDLLTGRGPNGGNTDAFPSRDDVVRAVRSLTPEGVTAGLDAVRTYATSLPACNGKSATVGYCWGGAKSFAYAVSQPALNAAVVFYGTAPDPASLSTVHAPVLGLYGGDDQRVNATIDTTAGEMKRLGKTYEVEVYPGAGHGFLRAQTGREGANLKATQQAWPRTLAFLREHTR